MSFSNAMLVFRKDWREIRRNWQILGPIIGVPLLIALVFPVIIIAVPYALSIPGTNFNNPISLITNLPADIKNQLHEMNADAIQTMVYVFVEFFFAPFFLIIPIMAASVLSADSFAGEKDRKTIEALLATPLTDGELLLGKILVSFIPAMLVTLLSFAVYCTAVDIGTYGMFNGMILLPNFNWLLMIFGVTPAVALAGIGFTVIVSLRVKGFREAQQLSALLVLPIFGLILAQVGGTIVFGMTMLVALIIGFAALDIVIFYFGIKIFSREDVLVSSI
jgi:ABC-type transport system involved in multi-copper enzyme maturation permease subunit